MEEKKTGSRAKTYRYVMVKLGEVEGRRQVNVFQRFCIRLMLAYSSDLEKILMDED